MMLLAALPVAWLVGRRTAPVVRVSPLLVERGAPAIVLEESRRGLAAGGSLTMVETADDPQAVYRLQFTPRHPGQPDASPYRLRLEGPDGGEIWLGTWNGDDARVPLELVLSGESLRPGRHALRIEDRGGVVTSYLFVVTRPSPRPPR